MIGSRFFFYINKKKKISNLMKRSERESVGKERGRGGGEECTKNVIIYIYN